MEVFSVKLLRKALLLHYLKESIAYYNDWYMILFTVCLCYSILPIHFIRGIYDKVFGYSLSSSGVISL